jgi:hypothetical protein
MNMRAGGWQKITSVEVERFYDGEYEPAAFAHVVVQTDKGDVFAMDTQHGETEEDNAAALRLRGWTNERCVLLFPRVKDRD